MACSGGNLELNQKFLRKMIVSCRHQGKIRTNPQEKSVTYVTGKDTTETSGKVRSTSGQWQLLDDE